MKPRSEQIWRWGFVILALVVVTVTSLNTAKVWIVWVWVVPALLIAQAVAVAVNGEFVARRRKRDLDRLKDEKEFGKIGETAAFGVAEAMQIDDVREIGVGYFAVKEPGWFSRTVRRNQAVLDRRFRFRFANAPGPTKIDWTIGKGTIGRVWQLQRKCHRDWTKITKRWADLDISTSDWANIPAETQGGFSREEFQAMVGRYDEILALPVTDEGGVLVGCLSIDVAHRKGVTRPQALLGDYRAEKIGHIAIEAMWRARLAR